MSHCCRSFHFIVNTRKFFIRSSWFHSIHVHDLFLIYQCHRLLLHWVVENLSLEFINYLIFPSEKDNSRKIFITLRRSLILFFGWCLLCKTSIDLFVINHYLKFINSSSWSLAVIPELYSTDCLGLLKSNAYKVRDAIVSWVRLLLSFLLSGSWGNCGIRSCILKWSKPHIVLIESLILSIRQICGYSYIIRHSLQYMDS